MAGYTLYPDDDKKQISGSAITATSTLVDGGSAFALGVNAVDRVLTAKVLLGDHTPTVFDSVVVTQKDVFSAFQSSGTAITSVGDSGGYCQFTLNGHSLTVGTVINVYGSTSGNVDGPQKVTAKDTNTFTTNKKFTAAATAGSYKLVAGRFASMTPKQYIFMGDSCSVAGGQATRIGYGSDHGIRHSIHYLLHLYTRRVATAIRAGYWNEFTGQWSTKPTNADDASTMGNDHAAILTRASPGELIYRVSGNPDFGKGVVQKDYPAKKNG